MREVKFWQAAAAMIGYVMGVGMFGLPFLVSKSGIVSFLVLLGVLTIAQYTIHLIYANVVIESPSHCRLPGHADFCLGKKWKHITFIVQLIGNYGALLAYIIITGLFLNQLLAPYFGGNDFMYGSILFFIEAAIVLLGIKAIARAEFLMTAALVLSIGVICFKAFGEININNYTFSFDKNLLLPYGAMLFALDGVGSIPLVVGMLGKKKEQIKNVIRIGTFLPAALILIFVVVILGVSGPETSPDALYGISRFLGQTTVMCALVFGVLAMVTSFLGVAENVREIFSWDYKINKYLAWILAVFVPYVFYVVGFASLTEVISFTGAITGGFSGIILILIFFALKKKKGGKLALFEKNPSPIILFSIIGLFIAGLAYEIFAFFGK